MKSWLLDKMTNQAMRGAARIKLLLMVVLGSPLGVHSDLDLTTQGAEVFESRWVYPF